MKAVPGCGPKRPLFIIVGELPGEIEEQTGVPFTGTDGHILDGMLASVGIPRAQCYITNVGKVRAPQSKAKNLYQLGFKIEDFWPTLYEELRGIDCKYAILLGDYAINALCGVDGIMKHRGSVYQSTVPGLEHLTCICTYNPGFVREMWQARGVVVEDLRKAVRVSRGEYTPMTFDTMLSPTFDACGKFIDRLRKECRAVSLDIEVVGRPSQIACVGIGGVFSDGRHSLCIPFKHGYRNYWPRLEEIFVWNMLQGLLHDPHILKIGQYLLYDFTMLAPFIGMPAPPWFDTNVAHHLIDPELPHTLAFMTSVYVDVNYYKDDPKDESESWKYMTSSEQLWAYNGKDVEVPLCLEPLMTEELRHLGMLDFMRGYQMPLLRASLRMAQRGMCVDETARQSLLDSRLTKVATMQAELDAAVGHPINVNSPKQMFNFVYVDCGLPIQYHRKTRRPTLDKGALEKLASRYSNPTFQQALDMRKVYKEIGTYLMATPSEDGKMRGKYNPTGTETGRTSCTQTIFMHEVTVGDKTVLKQVGLDMQNVPEDLRGMFIPSPGKTFLMYDCWQGEAYFVAVFSQCLPFLTRLRAGKKIYKLVASWLFNKPEEEVDDDNGPKGEYGRAKKVTHGADYGLGPGLLSALLKCPQAEAKVYLEKFHTYALEIRAWHTALQEELKQTRRLTNPFGRTRAFRARYGEDMFREAYSGLPQGSLADTLHQAQVKLEYMLQDVPGAGIVHEGFDSLVIECWRQDSERVKALAVKAFDKQLWWRGYQFKIPVECKEGERWK